MKIVKRYLYAHEAYLDRAKLSDEEIDSFVRDDNMVSLCPYLAQAFGYIKLMVNEEDLERALGVLESNEYEELHKEFDDNEIEPQNVCPYCGSINIIQERSAISALFFFLAFDFPFALRKSSNRCFDCNETWPIPKE